MKGIMAILEATLAGIIIVMLFLYFFPQYQSKNEWNSLLLKTTTQDILNVIDLKNKTYEFATNDVSFNNFMRNILSSDSVYVWWKNIDNLPSGKSNNVFYFVKAKKSTIIDVVYEGDDFRVYSFTLYLGYVF